MEIKNLKLKNYRNFENLDIDFSNTLNIIYGNNGAGKSNIVEAIYLLALTKSFRTNNEFNLIKENTPSARINGTILANDDKTRYEVSLQAGSKEVFIDHDKVKKLSDYISKIHIVLFNPLDTKVITDSPLDRRKMLNIEISQINKDYLLLLSAYNKILKNRNAYLKQLYLSSNASKDYLNILTKKLIEIGLKIYEIRNNYLIKINELISKIYQNTFEEGNLTIKYESRFKVNDVEKLFNLYQKNYSKEMEMGKTLFGVHHDDIDFLLDNHSIKEYGSIGQQKNAIISFKLAEVLIVKELTGDFPILILDDLFSELDNDKINNIISMLNKEVQTFITTTNIDKIDSNLLNNSTIFKVTNANIEKEN